MTSMRNLLRWGLFSFLILIPFMFSSAYYWKAKATGGIVPKGTPDVFMRREQLAISPGKVSAEYELANDTSHDIVTQVVFLVPEYGYNSERPDCDIADFRVWADGKAIPYEIEARAFVDGIERTDVLNKLGITIETFGFFEAYDTETKDGKEFFRHYEINSLAQEKKAKLVELGVVNRDLGPRWSVRKVYQWTQRFPAYQVVRIRHEYAPVYGITQKDVIEIKQELKDSCLSSEHLTKMRDAEAGETGWAGYVGSIQYVLTTANAWKGPIRDFELIINNTPRPRSWPAPKFVSFCWGGIAATPDKLTYVIREKDFVPNKDLTVYYYW